LPRVTLKVIMVFVLDNYDSFTYNLVQYLGELGAEVEVYRNDELTVEQVEALHPDRILLSPGPCTPSEAGILVPLIRHMAGKAPILGVCLGHQAIGEAFGGQVVRASHLMHGKTSSITHDGKGIFAGLASPLTCTRYHSLIVAEESLPKELIVTARTQSADGKSRSSWACAIAPCPSRACNSTRERFDRGRPPDDPQLFGDVAAMRPDAKQLTGFIDEGYVLQLEGYGLYVARTLTLQK
jgi:anthranilate synthase/aminodeoxychorismate synthase-like glutamine amidotransferase